MTGKRTPSAYTEPQTLRQHRENRVTARVDAGGYVVSLELHGDTDADFMRFITRQRTPLDPADIVYDVAQQFDHDGRPLTFVETHTAVPV